MLRLDLDDGDICRWLIRERRSADERNSTGPFWLRWRTLALAGDAPWWETCRFSTRQKLLPARCRNSRHRRILASFRTGAESHVNVPNIESLPWGRKSRLTQH